MQHYLGIMMPPQESDAWSYDRFTRRLVSHMQSSDDWAQGITKINKGQWDLGSMILNFLIFSEPK